MAVKKFILAAGQSNSTDVGDAFSWEDLYPQLALRSENATALNAPTFTRGAYHDVITLPYTFGGGPVVNYLGDGARVGEWQTANCYGRAVQAINYLTFYNPVASYLNLGTGYTEMYPGTGTVAAGSLPDLLVSDVRWQYDPKGVVITRRRTNTEHTIQTAANPGWGVGRETQAIVDPPMFPAPEVGEHFTYQIVGGVASASADELMLNNQFGGIDDIGTLIDEPTFTGAVESKKHAVTIAQSGETTDPALVIVRSRPLAVGQCLTFTESTLLNDFSTAATASMVSPNLTTDVYAAWQVGDAVVFQAGNGILPTEIVAGTTYYIRTVSDGVVTLSATSDLAAELTFDAAFSQGSTGPNMASAPDLPATVTGGDFYYITRLADDDVEETATTWDDLTTDITVPGHKITSGEEVRFSGTVPTNISTSTTYFATVVDTSTINVAATLNGAAIAATGNGSGLTITRRDTGCGCYVSTTPGGPEITAASDPGRWPSGSSIRVQIKESFRGSLTGLVARCTSGTNIGETRDLEDVYYNGSKAVVRCSTVWGSTPQADDTYLIEAPDGIPFKQWALWLPWSPFEGNAPWNGPGLLPSFTATSGAAVTLTVTSATSGIITPQVGARVRLYTSGSLPTPLRPGRDYFVATASGSSITLKESYSSTASITGDGVDPNGSGMHAISEFNQRRTNPFPPGFNTPNHYSNPQLGQPFDGPSLLPFAQPRIAFHTPLGFRLYEHLGEIIHIATAGFGGTSIGHKEVYDDQGGGSHGFMDVTQLKSWAPGEPNNCFARMLDVLEAAKTAFAKEGHTGECVGIFWNQGEEDANFETMANVYEHGLLRLKTAMRQAIKDKGLFSGSADKIPFIAPLVKEIWPYSDTVNAAIVKHANDDPYSRYFAIEDLPVLTDKNPPDLIHYSGAGCDGVANRAFDAWLAVQRVGSSEVEICNLALSNLGESASITSIDPPDGSAHAAVCAQFYPIARDIVLERHAWDFTTKYQELTAITETRADWDYAYTYPDDVSGILLLVDKDIGGDQYDAGYRTSKPYTVEQDLNGDRIIYTNQKNAAIRYSATVTDSTQFSQLAKKAISWELSAALAGYLVKGEEGAASARKAAQMAQFYGAQAQKHDSNRKRQTDPNLTSPWRR